LHHQCKKSPASRERPCGVRSVHGCGEGVSSPDKVFFAERGETKLDLVRYYEAVSGPILAAMGDRPLLLERYPDGAGGSSFFQKRVPKNAPRG
jgi:DNA primase